MKTCQGCLRELPLSKFHVNRRAKDGRLHKCASCMAAYKSARAGAGGLVHGVQRGQAWEYRGTVIEVSAVVQHMGGYRVRHIVGGRQRTVPLRWLLAEGRRVDEAAE